MKLDKLLFLILFIVLLPVILKVAIKLLPLLLFFMLLSLIPYGKIIGKIFKTLVQTKKFENTPGQIYKQCAYCKKGADKKALNCDFCGRSFE